jgi:uncharacterized protein (UPF0332 family)
MSLKTWHDNGWLRPHETSAQEISNLLNIVARDLTDAGSSSVSDDWRFGIAYNAALKLCTVLLYASGYRPEKNLAHYRTLLSLPEILGSNRKQDAEYLDRCRQLRNTVEYDYVGEASRQDADELIDFTRQLDIEVREWLSANKPDLLPPDSPPTKKRRIR